MSDELTPRQITAIKAVKENPGCTAKVVADAIEPGSDARGAAQTLRRLVDRGYIVRTEVGGYEATEQGWHAV